MLIYTTYRLPLNENEFLYLDNVVKIIFSIMRNIEYSRTLAQLQTKNSPYYSVLNHTKSTFFDTACLEFCKVFGSSKNNDTHYSNLNSDEMNNFKSYLNSINIIKSKTLLENRLIPDNMSKSDFDNYMKDSILKYRDEHLAHYDIYCGAAKKDRLKNYPDLSHAKTICINFYKLLTELCMSINEERENLVYKFIFYSQDVFTSIFEDEALQILKLFETTTVR